MLEPKPRVSWLVSLGAIACIAVLLTLVFGTYTSKVRVRGWLVPELGLARVAAPQPGVIEHVFVREGAEVRKGDRLITLSAELRTEVMGASREEAVRQLRARQQSLTEAKTRVSALAEQQRNELERRHSILRAEAAHLEKEISFQRARVRIVQQGVERERAMRARDLISLTRLQRTEQESLDASARLEAAERSKQTLLREENQVTAQLAELPGRTELQLKEHDRNIAALNQELTEAETKRAVVLVAPTEGTVTSLQAEPGTTVQIGAALMSVLPTGSRLIAQMFATSRGTGFLRAGQTVRLRYRAYPFQKFGFQDGTVASVSRAAMSPSELSPQLAGLSSLFSPNEPIYRVLVELKAQNILAYGEAVALQPGMEVEADILVETRRLIEWVLDPIWTITGGRPR